MQLRFMVMRRGKSCSCICESIYFPTPAPHIAGKVRSDWGKVCSRRKTDAHLNDFCRVCGRWAGSLLLQRQVAQRLRRLRLPGLPHLDLRLCTEKENEPALAAVQFSLFYRLLKSALIQEITRLDLLVTSCY